MLGGSSSINGMVYVRGNPLDFDRWEEQGAEGWGYRDVLPYFRRADAHEGGDRTTAAATVRCITATGAWTIRCTTPGWRPARQAGYPATPDFNGYQQEGFGRMAMSVHQGRRWSAANAYLRPAMRRGNLRVLTHARATRVLFSDRRAAGVAYRRGGEEREVHATREVILAAGRSTARSC